MSDENLIPANEFCIYHNIEISFLQSLKDYGLIEIVTKEDQTFLVSGQLNELEKLIRLHYELDINLEGLDAVVHLLQKLHDTQEEMTRLKNRLRIYDGGE